MAVSKGTVEVKGQTASEYIQGLIDKANRAKEKFMELNQEQVDGIVQAMAMAGLEKHMRLAKMAVEETGRGVYEDKIIKTCLPRSISTTALNTTKP